ncbi:MAG: serine hydrolase [Cyanobacteriota bacterium]|nr:serine hydrolase [Cyanobacteriota bacterium]
MTFFQTDETLKTLGSSIIEATRRKFQQLSPEQIAITWIVYDRPADRQNGQSSIRGWSDRGEERIYPASIVKLFYLVAYYQWLEKGMLKTSSELERGVRDMIIDSSNDATSLVVDALTGTTSGPELSSGPFQTWKYQRNLVNRYFQSLKWPELDKINVNQKTWCEGPYGRERAFLGEMFENRNMLTARAVARLFHSIVGGRAVSAAASQAMMKLMKRSLDPEELAAEPENQVTGFLGGGLPQSAQLWSKAGWTGQVRHDAAYIELPGLLPYLLIVFMEGKANSNNEEILPFISQEFVKTMENQL